jgi:uncharacterized membrane protein
MVIQRILAQPWIALIFVLILMLLWLAAWRRCRHDRMLRRQHQAREKGRNRSQAARDADGKSGIDSDQSRFTRDTK